jgi:pseudaminic acid cytidylyltransferase
MNICVIPARGGSKRIPRKNIKFFNGKPIIAYSIKAALESRHIDKVIVSTDDQEIANIALEYGAEVPFYRPQELSNDHCTIGPVISHAVDWMENNGSPINHICCLFATAPFIEEDSISNAYNKFIEKEADLCLSVASFPFPIQRAVKISKSGVIEVFNPEFINTRSQDLEESYHDAGQFCWGTKHAFRMDSSWLSEVVIPFVLPRYLVQDIDSLEDWKKAEIMYKVIQEMNNGI